jgi:hypothetical protein
MWTGDLTWHLQQAPALHQPPIASEVLLVEIIRDQLATPYYVPLSKL